MKLSIIIPLYNNEEFISDAVRSLYKQGLSEEEFEVIIVNDGSTDNSQTHVETLMKKYSNIRLIVQDNRGVGAARNNGLLQSKGEFVLFLDSDDYYLDWSIKEIVDLAFLHNLDLLMCNQAIHVSADKKFIKDDSKDFLGQSIFRDNSKILKGSELLEFSTFNDGIVCTLFKTNFLLENNIFFPLSSNLEDLQFLYTAIIKCARMISSNKQFYVVRHSANSATRHNNFDKLKNSIESIVNVLAYLQNDSINRFGETSPQTKLLKQKINNYVITALGYFSKISRSREEATHFICSLKEKGLVPVTFDFYRALPLKSKIAYFVSYHPLIYLRRFK